MADPFVVNKQLQLGVEATSGTLVPANKLLPSMLVDFDPTFDVTKIKGSGRRFASIIVPSGQEGVTGRLSGGVTYTELVYPMSMIWGAAAITTPAGGVAARQWVWTPPLSGRTNPKSVTLEQGDADDSERVGFAVLTDFGLDLSRAASTLTGGILGQAIEKYSTLSGGSWTGMTAAPTAIGLVPVLPKKWDAFMDSTSVGLGNTKLLRCFKATMAYGGAFTPYYPMNSALTSFAGVADGEDIGATLSLLLVKDPVGESLWTQARAGAFRYIRLVALGDFVDNYATVSVSGGPTGGTFILSYKGANYTINFNHTAAALQTTLQTALGASNVTVTGGPLPTTPLVITLAGTLLADSAVFTVGTNSLTGGATPTPSVVMTQIPFKLQIDVAGKITKPGNTDGTQGLRTRQWDFQMAEDPTWGSGAALMVTLVNNLTSL